jgi:hypothetical protein
VRWLALVLLVLGLGGCGSGQNGGGAPSNGQRSGNKLTQHDAEVVARIDRYVNAWNAAAGKWSRTYKSGNRAKILRLQDGYGQKLHESSIRIRLSASQLEDRKLQELLRNLGDAYRRQFRAIIAVNNSVTNADIRAGQRGIAELQRATEAKIRVDERLVDAYPELGL